MNVNKYTVACPVSSPLVNTRHQYKTEGEDKEKDAILYTCHRYKTGEDKEKDAILFLFLKPYTSFTQLAVAQMIVRWVEYLNTTVKCFVISCMCAR